MFLLFSSKLKQCLSGIESPGWHSHPFIDSCPTLMKASVQVWAGRRLCLSQRHLGSGSRGFPFTGAVEMQTDSSGIMEEVSQCPFPWVSTWWGATVILPMLAFWCPSGVY